VHDQLLYAVELEGRLHCLDASNGKLHWTHDFQSQVWGSPMWVDGKLFIGTLDGDLFAFRHGKDKKLLAKTSFDQPIATAPVVANGVMYVMTDRGLYALR
jgi:outer membrane protein assembly factor BamB